MRNGSDHPDQVTFGHCVGVARKIGIPEYPYPSVGNRIKNEELQTRAWEQPAVTSQHNSGGAGVDPVGVGDPDHGSGNVVTTQQANTVGGDLKRLNPNHGLVNNTGRNS